MLKNIFNKIERWKYLLLVLSFSLTGVSVYFTAKLGIKADLLELLPSHFETVKSLHKISRLIGGIGYLTVVVEGPNRADNIAFVEKFSETAKLDTDVVYVDYKYPVTFLEKNAILWLPLDDIKLMHDDLFARISYFRKRAISLLPDELGPPPSFRTKKLMLDMEKKISSTPYHENSTGTFLITIIKPRVDSTDIAFTKVFCDRMREMGNGIKKEYPGVSFEFTDIYQMKYSQIEQLSRDLFVATLFTVFGVSLVLFIFFRSPKAIVIAGYPLVSGIIWALALNYFLVGHVNIISSFFVSVLIGVGIDYSIQIYSRFKEEYEKTPDYQIALYKSFITTGKGTLFGALTTLAVFVILIFSSFLTFKETGILGTMGIVLIFISILIHLPLMTFLLKPKFRWFKKSKVEEKNSLSVKLIGFIFYKRWAIVFGTIGFLFIGSFFLTSNKFEYDFTALENSDYPARIKWDQIIKEFKIYLRPSIIMVESMDDLVKIRAHLNKMQEEGNEYISRHFSILDFYTYPQSGLKERMSLIDDTRNLLLKNMGNMAREDREKVQKYMKYLSPEVTDLDEYPRSIKNSFFVNKDGKRYYFYQIFPPPDVSMGLKAMMFGREIKKIVKDLDIKADIASDVILLDEILTLVITEGEFILPVAILTIFLLIIWLFRSLKKALIVMLPLALGIYFLASAQGLSNIIFSDGISLNYLNVVVIPILFGVGIDYSIHIYHRLEEVFEHYEKSQEERWHEVVRTAYTLLISAITTVTGFASLFLANYVGLRSIAWVAVLGNIFILLVSSLFLPALFFILHGKSIKFTNGDSNN